MLERSLESKSDQITLEDLTLVQAIDTYVSKNRVTTALALNSLKRNALFEQMPLVSALLSFSSLNPLLEEGIYEQTSLGDVATRSRQGEYFLPKEALSLFVYFKFLKHPKSEKTYNTKNIFVVDNSVNKLSAILVGLNLNEDEDAKIIYIDQIHAIPFYLRKEKDILKVFIVDSEISHCYDILSSIHSVFKDENFKIIESSTHLQRDYFSCSLFSIKALQYFVKHGAEIFPYLDQKTLEKKEKSYRLAEIDLMPHLLKMSQTWTILDKYVSLDTKKTIVSIKQQLTLEEYQDKHSVAVKGKKFNTKAIELNYKYFAFLEKKLNEELNADEKAELQRKILPKKLKTLLKDLSSAKNESSSMILDRYMKLASESKPVETKKATIEDINEILNTLDTNEEEFSLTEYAKMLPLATVAAKMEKQEEGKEKVFAARLILVFGNYENALHYLKKCEHNNKKNKVYSGQFFHDACLLNLPSGYYTSSVWHQLATQHLPGKTFNLIVSFAGSIERAMKQDREHHIKQMEIDLKSAPSEREKKQYQEEYEGLKKAIDQCQIKTIKAIQKEIDYLLRKELFLENKLDESQAKIFNQYKNEIMPVDFKTSLIERMRNLMQVGSDAKPVLKQNKVLSESEIIKFNAIIEKHLQAFKLKFKPVFQYTLEEYINFRIEQNQKISNKARIKIYKKKPLLTAQTPLSLLQNFAAKISYRNGYKNVKAAKIFLENGISKTDFDKYLKLTPVDDEKQIPQVTILGDDLDAPGYYITKLHSSDPRAAILGHFTSCCQSLSDFEEVCVISGITQPHCGFYVICEMAGTKPSTDDLIVSQSYVWRSEKKALVFDSIESQTNFINKHPDYPIILFEKLAEHLVAKNNIPRVVVGRGGQTPKSIGYFPLKVTEKPILPAVSSADSRIQVFLADQSHCFLFENSEEKTITLTQLHELTEIYAFNQYSRFGKKIKNYLDLQFKHLGWRAEKSKKFTDAVVYLYRWIAKSKDCVLLSPDKLNQLIEVGVDVNYSFYQDTILGSAVETGNMDLVTYLLESQNVNFDVVDAKGNTLLHKAVLTNNLTLLTLLLNILKHKILEKNKFGKTILHLATTKDRLRIFQFLLYTFPALINSQNAHGDTALHLAASFNLDEHIQLLFKFGADATIVNNHDKDALNAALISISIQNLYYFLAQKYQIHQIRYRDNSVRYIVSDKEYHNKLIRFFNFLLKNEYSESTLNDFVNLNDKNILMAGNAFQYMLEVIFYKKQFDLAKYQQIARAEVVWYKKVNQNQKDFFKAFSVSDFQEQKWVDLSSFPNNSSLLAKILDEDRGDLLAELIHKKIILLRDLDAYSENFFHLSVRYRAFNCAKALFSLNLYDLNYQESGMTNLYVILIDCKDMQFIKDCIEAKDVDLNFKDIAKQTYLHVAASLGHLEIVKLLLEKGADVNALCKRGHSSLYLAKRNRNVAVVDYLEQVMGCKPSQSGFFSGSGVLSQLSECMNGLVSSKRI